MGPLAGEPPYATGGALKRKKKKKRRRRVKDLGFGYVELRVMGGDGEAQEADGLRSFERGSEFLAPCIRLRS